MSFTNDEMRGTICRHLTWANMPAYKFKELSGSLQTAVEGNVLVITQPLKTPKQYIFTFTNGRWVFVSGRQGNSELTTKDFKEDSYYRDE